MKKRVAIFTGSIAALLAIAGVLLFTPFTDPNLTAHPQPMTGYQQASSAIDGIKAEEAKLDLIPEGHSIAMLSGSRTETAVVIFHGYTSVPQQFKTVAEGYRAAGYNVWVPRLPYHGSSDKMTRDFSKIDAQLLREFADKNVDIASGLGKHVVVLGFSGGGSMAVWSGMARTDVSETILISPVLHPLGIPVWADRPLVRALRLSPVDVYKWWDPVKKASDGAVEGYNYPRLSLKFLAGALSLSHWVDARAARGPLSHSRVLLVRNDGDQRLDSAYNEAYIKRVARAQDLEVYRIPRSAGLLHNFISVETYSEGHKTIVKAYEYLADALGTPMPDPLGAR
jgi:carboxylesterase